MFPDQAVNPGTQTRIYIKLGQTTGTDSGDKRSLIIHVGTTNHRRDETETVTVITPAERPGPGPGPGPEKHHVITTTASNL